MYNTCDWLWLILPLLWIVLQRILFPKLDPHDRLRNISQLVHVPDKENITSTVSTNNYYRRPDNLCFLVETDLAKPRRSLSSGPSSPAVTSRIPPIISAMACCLADHTPGGKISSKPVAHLLTLLLTTREILESHFIWSWKRRKESTNKEVSSITRLWKYERLLRLRKTCKFLVWIIQGAAANHIKEMQKITTVQNTANVSAVGCSLVDPWVKSWQGQSTLGWL